MAWLTENWFWILTFIAFIAMHMFGHGGHGGHGSHGGGNRKRSADGSQSDEVQSRTGDSSAGGHRH
jgi:hypothetical protein